MNKIMGAVSSKRFWALVIGGALTAANNYLKILDDHTMLEVIAIISALVIGDSYRAIGTK